jgi:hypothetical protein
MYLKLIFCVHVTNIYRIIYNECMKYKKIYFPISKNDKNKISNKFDYKTML